MRAFQEGCSVTGKLSSVAPTSIPIIVWLHWKTQLCPSCALSGLGRSLSWWRFPRFWRQNWYSGSFWGRLIRFWGQNKQITIHQFPIGIVQSHNLILGSYELKRTANQNISMGMAPFVELLPDRNYHASRDFLLTLTVGYFMGYKTVFHTKFLHICWYIN